MEETYWIGKESRIQVRPVFTAVDARTILRAAKMIKFGKGSSTATVELMVNVPGAKNLIPIASHRDNGTLPHGETNKNGVYKAWVKQSISDITPIHNTVSQNPFLHPSPTVECKQFSSQAGN